MRFHIGFSKFIKPKNILHWLAFGFFGLLTFFGFLNHGFALTSNIQPSMFYNLNGVTQYPSVSSSASDYYYFPSVGGRDFHAIYDLDGLCPSDSGSIVVQINFLDSQGNYLYKSSNFQVKYNGTNDSLNYTILNYSNVSGFAKIQIDNVDMTKDLLIISNLDDYSNVGIFAIHNTFDYTCNAPPSPPSSQGTYNICDNQLYNNATIQYSDFNNGVITHGNIRSDLLNNFEFDCNQASDPDDYLDISRMTTSYDNLFRSVKSNTTSKPVLNNIELDLNDNFCSGINDIRSLDLFFSIKQNTLNFVNQKISEAPFNNHYGQFTNYNQLLSFYVEPVYSGENVGPPVDYACNLSSNGNDSNLYNITCIGVPYDSNVIDYKIKVYNNFYYSLDNRDNIYYITNENYTFFSRIALYKDIDYQCSTTSPVSPDEPLFPDDLVGSANIIVNDTANGIEVNTNGSINFDFIHLVYPNTFTQFLEFPLYLANALVNNHSVCNPINIDFSSLTRRFGGSDYVLTLPCLGSTIRNVFSARVGNISVYDLIDMFIAFYLLYLLAMRMVQLINMMLSGQDMVGYLYSGTDQVIGTDGFNPKTGEVIFKKHHRRY